MIKAKLIKQTVVVHIKEQITFQQGSIKINSILPELEANESYSSVTAAQL